MKREDVYRSRGKSIQPVRSRTGYRNRRAGYTAASGRQLYPFCHWLQIIVSVLVFFLLLYSHVWLPEQTADMLLSNARLEIEAEMHLTEQPWKKPLKEWLYTEK